MRLQSENFVRTSARKHSNAIVSAVIKLFQILMWQINKLDLK